MTLSLSPRMSVIAASATATAMARAAAAKAAGRPVISLTTGEPDFDTPGHIQDAAIAAMRAGQTRYTAVDGTPELKRAVAEKFRRENGIDYTVDEVCVGTGAKQVIFNAVLAVIGDGDEAVIPAPSWVSYPDMVKLAGGAPVMLDCGPEAAFKPTAKQIAGKITDRTRLIILNSPCNPTGAVLSAQELQAIGEVVRGRPDILVICDDIYEHLTYGAEFATLAQVCSDLKGQVLTVNGVSKAFAMTGWRIGYGGGPAELIRAMRVLQSQSTTNPCSVAQAAAVAALDGGLETVRAQTAAFARRRETLLARLRGMNGVTVQAPDGAFYLFIGIAGLLGRTSGGRVALSDEDAVVSTLLDEANLGVVGGAGFGMSPYFRISFAASDEILAEAMDRLEAFLAAISG